MSHVVGSLLSSVFRSALDTIPGSCPIDAIDADFSLLLSFAARYPLFHRSALLFFLAFNRATALPPNQKEVDPLTTCIEASFNQSETV
jgi:hypothetical protein